MTMCLVCGKDLPAQRGPRARRYCSRACQAKAYRARQRQRDAHRLTSGEEAGLLAEYDGVASLELADQLALAARRLAGALNAGQPADDFDLGVVARIPAVLAARAHRTDSAGQAHQNIPDARTTARATAVDPAARTPAPSQDRPASHGTSTEASCDGREHIADGPAAAAPRPSTSSRDASRKRADKARPLPKGIEPKPQKLARKRALAIVDVAELVRDVEHRDEHRWILRSGDTVLGHVEPTYGGTSASGRTGWTSRLGVSTGRRCRTRDEAKLDLAARWIRIVTAAPRTP
ncbi:hypothetical protein [Streptomyces sp. NPDC056165]|uniref:hypothetical protein n=1 Tax=Streptomyces sp. NPDC056165 TaxID=3345733 RepID=UPI0035D80EBA